MHSKVNTTARRIAALAAAATVVPAVGVALAPAASAAPDSVWDELAQCESSGDWSANTGNGFSGGLQFTPSTWRAFGGSGAAHNASRAEQIRVAENVLDGQGWGAWPACSAKLGLRGVPATPREAPPAREPAPKPAPKPAPVAAVDSGRGSDGTGSYTCTAAKLGFAACDPDNIGDVVQYPRYDGHGSAQRASSAVTHTVAAGDTLSRLAAEHGTTVARLAAINGIADADLIYVGAVLRVA